MEMNNPQTQAAQPGAQDIKGYITRLLAEKASLESEKEKLRQGVIKYAEAAKALESQNREQRDQLAQFKAQMEALKQQASQPLPAPKMPLQRPAAAQFDANDITETLMAARRTARQMLAEAEQKAILSVQGAQKELNDIYFIATQLQEALKSVVNGLSEVLEAADARFLSLRRAHGEKIPPSSLL